MNSDIVFKTCFNCKKCKTKNDKIYCKEGKFKNVSEDDIRFYTPYDFDCEKWEE